MPTNMIIKNQSLTAQLMDIMKKFISLLLFAISFNVVYAQTATYACQFTESDGFAWRNGKWERAAFIVRKPFFLKFNGEKIDLVSAYNAISPDPLEDTSLPNGAMHCQFVSKKVTSCMSWMGNSLIFSTSNFQGATAAVYGSTNDGKKDSVEVSLFTCQKM